MTSQTVTNQTKTSASSLPLSMKTVEMREPGGADVLTLGTRDLPECRDQDVLIKVHYAGVNGPDLVQRRGHYPPPKGASDLLGLEVSGEVVGVGAGVTRWPIGTPVIALTNGGGYAEYVAVDADHVLPLPEDLSMADAAGLPETFFTVWSNAFFRHTITQGDVFLVHGGSGGIGATAIQIGTALGMTVITTADGAEACQFCRDLGAKVAVDFRTEDFVPITRDAGGASIILDIIGGDYIARNIKAAKHDARLISLAFNKGSKIDIDLMPMMLKRLTLTGSTLRSRPDEFKAAVARDLEEKLWPLFDPKSAHPLRPTTDKIFPMAEAAAAHQFMESGQQRGKILLEISPAS